MNPATHAPDAELATDRHRTELALLARASRQELATVWNDLPDKPAFEPIRPPEVGLVMARGRIGGGGAPFNIGEVTITRALVRLAGGEVGFGHILGRDPERATLVACFDALLRTGRYRDRIAPALLDPVRRRSAADDTLTRQKTAATRVNFFTMVRGEDE